MGFFFVLFFGFTCAVQTWGCPEGPAVVPLPEGSLSEAFSLVDSFVRSSLHGTYSVGIVFDQQLVHSVSSSSSSSSAFRIGSNSKLFTSLLVLLAHRDGLLHLDDPVSDLFPAAALLPNRWSSSPNQSFSWRQLLSHRAGLARDSPCQSLWGQCNVSLSEVFSVISSWPAVAPTASRPSYSNLGFSLAGQMAASLFRSDFVSLVHSRILRPLGMTHSGFSNGTAPSFLVSGVEAGLPVPDFNFGFDNPAGGMYSSVDDLQKLISMLFRDESPVGGAQLLDGSAIREWLSPVWLGAGAPLTAYGAPWEMVLSANLPDSWIRGKRGDVLGYSSQVALLPELKLGVVVLTANGVSTRADLGAWKILEILAPKVTAVLQANAPPPPSWPSSLVGEYVGKDVFSVSPPFLGKILLNISHQNNTSDVFFVLQAVLGNATRPTLLGGGFLRLSPPDSDADTEMYRILLDTTQCSQATEGDSQFISRSTKDGSLRIDGLYFGFVFVKKRN